MKEILKNIWKKFFGKKEIEHIISIVDTKKQDNVVKQMENNLLSKKTPTKTVKKVPIKKRK